MSADASRAAAGTSRRPARILVVDDEAPNRLGLERILKREGYEVLTAGGAGAEWNDWHTVRRADLLFDYCAFCNDRTASTQGKNGNISTGQSSDEILRRRLIGRSEHLATTQYQQIGSVTLANGLKDRC